MTASPGEVTLLLTELKRGNKGALGRLIPLVYRELHGLAAHYLAAERIGHTLQPTALVHEAYLRLVEQDRADWRNREQFLGVAARLMRRILVDYARARGAAKRDGAGRAAGLKPGADLTQAEEILEVDEALDRLAKVDPQQARVVELRYFSGLTIEETSRLLGISTRTVNREWTMASAWLRDQLSRQARE